MYFYHLSEADNWVSFLMINKVFIVWRCVVLMSIVFLFSVWSRVRERILHVLCCCLFLAMIVICLNTSSPFLYAYLCLTLNYHKFWVLFVYTLNGWYVSKQISFQGQQGICYLTCEIHHLFCPFSFVPESRVLSESVWTFRHFGDQLQWSVNVHLGH